MLFILTGGIRTGKTTWLEARCARARGGGRARARRARARRVARRREGRDRERALALARARPSCHAGGGRCAGGLGWDFDANALARVNAHLAALRPGGAAGLLAIDELGPLELRRGAGLTEALALLDAGPAPAWPHALVVVRSALAEEAAARLCPAWGPVELIRPDGAGASRLREALLART